MPVPLERWRVTVITVSRQRSGTDGFHAPRNPSTPSRSRPSASRSQAARSSESSRGRPSYAGVICTSAGTRSGNASANAIVVCAPIDAPPSAARSAPRWSSTASRSATMSRYSYSAGSAAGDDSPWPRASNVVTR